MFKYLADLKFLKSFRAKLFFLISKKFFLRKFKQGVFFSVFLYLINKDEIFLLFKILMIFEIMPFSISRPNALQLNKKSLISAFLLTISNITLLTASHRLIWLHDTSGFPAGIRSLTLKLVF